MVISKNDLKEFSSLKRKSKRLELGLFLVEGIKNCEELLASDYEVVAVLTTNNFLHEFPNAIVISSILSSSNVWFNASNKAVISSCDNIDGVPPPK